MISLKVGTFIPFAKSLYPLWCTHNSAWMLLIDDYVILPLPVCLPHRPKIKFLNTWHSVLSLQLCFCGVLVYLCHSTPSYCNLSWCLSKFCYLKYIVSWFWSSFSGLSCVLLTFCYSIYILDSDDICGISILSERQVYFSLTLMW